MDDWLIAETTLKRTFHRAKVQDGPVLKADHRRIRRDANSLSWLGD